MTKKKKTAKQVLREGEVRMAANGRAVGVSDARNAVWRAGVTAGKTEAKRGNTKKQKSGGSMYNAGANMAKDFYSKGNKSAVEIRKAAQKKRNTK